MTLRRRSLATVVAATLVAVTTVLLGTYSILSYRSDAARQKKTLQDLMMRQAKELSVALALPLWNLDRAQIGKVLEAMSQPKSVYGISVQSAGESYGRVRNSAWKIVPWDGKSAAEGMLIQEEPIFFGGNRIGTVRLLVTPEFLQNDLRATLLHIVSTIVAVDVLLILCTYLILWSAVVRPLTAIEKYAVAVSSGNVNAPHPPRGFTAELENVC